MVIVAPRRTLTVGKVLKEKKQSSRILLATWTSGHQSISLNYAWFVYIAFTWSCKMISFHPLIKRKYMMEISYVTPALNKLLFFQFHRDANQQLRREFFLEF